MAVPDNPGSLPPGGDFSSQSDASATVPTFAPDQEPASMLPPQLLPPQHHTTTAPAHIYTENVPAADPTLPSSGAWDLEPLLAASSASGSDPSFVEQANAHIDAALSRTDGKSVIEPDSVLGESGRLYHGYKEGKYMLPNDAVEQDRLDLQHEVFGLTFDGWLSLAPLPSIPKFVLDIGTGTGIWAIEFAKQFPNSYVIGTDLSAIQPSQELSNCVFQKDDAEEPWLYPLPTLEGHRCLSEECQHPIAFDYVHLRAMCSCFDDSTIVMKRAFENLNPGGWIEFQDLTFQSFQNNPAFPGDALLRWSDGCIRGAAGRGRDVLVSKKYKTMLEQVGFVDVKERRFVSPIGPWAEDPKLKQIGRYQLENLHRGIRGIGWNMLRASGMEPDAIELLLSQVEAEAMDNRNHCHSFVYVVYGRKPLEGEVG